MLHEFKSSMKREFEMTDLGELRFFLGIEVLQGDKGIFICRRKYASDTLNRFGMTDSNSVQTPIVPSQKLDKDECGEKVDATLFKQIVGSLMYLTTTRPDLIYAVSLISHYMAEPTMRHYAATKRIMRYLQGTMDYGVFYKRKEANMLIGYTDSDYAGDIEDSKSTSGYVFMLSGAAVGCSLVLEEATYCYSFIN